MNHWNEEDGVYEFKSRSADETARRSAATDSSEWVRRQLEWCQMDTAKGQPACSVVLPLGDQLIGKRHAPVTA